MATEKKIKANRRNAQKSTGPKTAEGKAVVAQNAVKHGLFAHENVIHCEKQADFDDFREELLAGLSPAGGVEAMLAERIVSLSWRLKRVERMNSEVIDAKIAYVETNRWQKEEREEAGLLDEKTGRSELALGWAVMGDFANAQVLERLLMYEKRIESSLYKAMNELQKLQHTRMLEHAKSEAKESIIPIPINNHLNEAATRLEDQTDQNKNKPNLASQRPPSTTLGLSSSNSEVNAKQSQITGLDRKPSPGGAAYASSTTL